MKQVNEAKRAARQIEAEAYRKYAMTPDAINDQAENIKMAYDAFTQDGGISEDSFEDFLLAIVQVAGSMSRIAQIRRKFKAYGGEDHN